MGKKEVINEPVIETEVVEEVVEAVEEPVAKKAKKADKVEADVVTTGFVATRALNVRKGPGLEFLPIGTLYEGNEIEYVPENDEWLKLMSGGYVMKKFIQ